MNQHSIVPTCQKHAVQCPHSLAPPLSPTVYGKPILPTSSSNPSPVPFLHGGVKAAEEDVPDSGKAGGETGERQVPPPNVDNIPRPLSPTKLTPVGRLASHVTTTPGPAPLGSTEVNNSGVDQ